MLEFSNVSVIGWDDSIRGMRNPLNSWKRIDSGYKTVYKNYTPEEGHEVVSEQENIEIPELKVIYEVGPNDKGLMFRLRNSGTDHRKFMRMINVFVDINAPLYWWKEFDTYKVGTVSNSCSTMHKIQAKEFTSDDFSYEHLNDSYKRVLSDVISCLNQARDDFNSTRDKKYWWYMIQMLPTSYNQKRTIQMNYEVLANMYKSRKNHKLDEWRYFCNEFIPTLPISGLVTGQSDKQ